MTWPCTMPACTLNRGHDGQCSPEALALRDADDRLLAMTAYVPSQKAVEASARGRLIASGFDAEHVDALVARYGWESAYPDALKVARQHLAAAVPVEVARLLQPLRDLADEWEKLENAYDAHGYDDEAYTLRDARNDLRSRLDALPGGEQP